MQGEIAYDWNPSSSSGTLSMRLIWSYSEYVLLLTPASQKKNTFSIDNLLDMTEVAEQITSTHSNENHMYYKFSVPAFLFNE